MKLVQFIVIVALAQGASVAANFSGTWKIENIFNGSSSIINCTIVQKGNKLSGSCKPQVEGIAATDLTGTVEGSTAKWGYDVVFNGKPSRVDYVADLGADGTFKGSLLRNGSPSPITGKLLPDNANSKTEAERSRDH